jgi:hypothetical protein
MSVPSNRKAVVGHRSVAFLDHVWLHVGVLRARYLIALARHKTAVETHRCGSSDDLAAVIGVVTNAYEIHHFLTVLVQSKLLAQSSCSLYTFRRRPRGLDARPW